MSRELIQPAQITWHGNQPYSEQFQDIYFSPDGEHEVARVFIDPCGLLNGPEADLVVGELGFGSGLNFVVLAQELLKQTDKRLHFISVDAHPLCYEDWQRISARHPNSALYRQLAAFPPPLLRGWHRRVFAAGRIKLSVFHGSASEAISELAAHMTRPVSAWFLDGFAPDRNPALWHPALLEAIASTCARGSRLATFTAVGRVRRALENIGFEMRKVDQRPHKRESLAGVYQGKTTREVPAIGPITVYGAGIAGAMVARHAAEAGLASTVVDPAGIATGASKMRHTLLHARLLGDQSVAAQLRSHAFHYATAYMANWSEQPAGALQVQNPNLDAAKLERLATAYGAQDPLNQHWIEYRTDAPDGLALASGEAHLWFPSSRVIDLSELSTRLLDHPLISLQAQPPTHTDVEIICCATATRGFEGLDWLELADVGGQLDQLNFTDPRVTVPVVGAGYLVPLPQGGVVGSSYEYQPWTQAQATAHNIARNQAYLPGQVESVSTQRAQRCVSSDRLPVVGKVNAQRFVFTGLGSMGTTYAPFGASVIISELIGDMPPLSAPLKAAMAPTRFIERQARRGVRHR